jgi:hypothetical protein
MVGGVQQRSDRIVLVEELNRAIQFKELMLKKEKLEKELRELREKPFRLRPIK